MNRNMLSDFHAVALSTTFLLFAFWYMEKKKYGKFIFFAILSALGKEQVWLTIAMMGLYTSFCLSADIDVSLYNSLFF
jgi:uncharacterized membrane protein